MDKYLIDFDSNTELKKDTIHIKYIDSFLSEKQSKRIFELFENELEYNTAEQSSINIGGNKKKIPRQQVAYGDDGTFFRFCNIQVNARSWNGKSKICKTLKEIKTLVEKETGEKFNFVLINRYYDGDDYIGPHKDDERDIVKDTSIIGVNLGAKRDMVFTNDHKNTKTKRTHTFPLKGGSLIIIKPPTNNFWYHSIPKDDNCNDIRISLTFRNMKIL
jgi:alpha-ketoglutarate-dependent dioxygenase alkB family protein 2